MSEPVILEIDVGNSRAKWRLIDGGGRVLDRGFCDLVNLAGLADGVQPSMVRVSSVRSASITTELAEQLHQRFAIAPEFAKVTEHCAGVVNGYKEPVRLGVDRWLAILAAFNRAKGACVVVDAGSAITLDGVSAAGQHLGGFIVPGYSVQARALLAGTTIASGSELPFGNSTLGADTESAIGGGIGTMVASWVETCFRSFPAGAQLYITGGDSAVLSCALDKKGLPHECVPELVLDGLALALPYGRGE
ncbi:MAG: type III pantothenate kinase [Pseudohongiellaceae bacterium]|nr:type III pantothenate kinase [Pseudohongiellaceae bacterium]